ncbi:hypothetical protein GCM10017673_46400 [Streptosporangium violaceochromogenes]|nr:hypothetical protein GCM10017673_46400 [Streptosporangium violaceochromogenes]
MRQVWVLWGGVIVTMALALPAAVAGACLLARRRASRGRPLPVRTAVADVGAVAGTAPWLWMILTLRPAPNVVDLVPFDDLARLFQHSAETAFTQAGGSLLVFAALGAALPARWARLARLTRVAGVAAGASLTVELLQYDLRLGRVSSVDDVLLNTAGAVPAAAATRRRWAGRAPVETSER